LQGYTKDRKIGNTMLADSSKNIQHNQKIENTTRSREIFSRVYCFYQFYIEQQIPRPTKKRKRKAYYSGKKKRHTVKTQFRVNKNGIIIQKTSKKKGRRHDYSIYKENHPLTPKQVVNVFDLGYLGVEKSF